MSLTNRTPFGIIPIDVGSTSTGGGGRSILSIQTTNNNDGSTILTFNFDDGTTEVASFDLDTDNLTTLNKIILEGTNQTDKFVVNRDNGTELLKVNTATGRMYVDNIIMNATNNLQKFVVYNSIGDSVLAVDTTGNRVIMANVPQGSTLAVGKHTLLYDTASGQLFYEASFQIAADGTKTFLDSLGNVILNVAETGTTATGEFIVKSAGDVQQFTVDSANSVATFTTNTYNVVTSSNEVQILQQTATNIVGGLLNIFKKK